MPCTASSRSRSSAVGVRNIRFSEPPKSWRRKRTKAFSFFAFWRKYPEDRTSRASFPAGAVSMARGVSIRSRRRLAMARSTFIQAVFWVRIAPTITSNGVFAGHQCIGPSAAVSVSKNCGNSSWGLTAPGGTCAGTPKPATCGADGTVVLMQGNRKCFPWLTIAGPFGQVKAGCGGMPTLFHSYRVLPLSPRHSELSARGFTGFCYLFLSGSRVPGDSWMSARLGEILIKESLITSEQLKQALEYQKQHGGRLGSCLMKMGFITDDEITAVLSRQYGVPSINLKYYEVDAAVVKLIPQDTAVRYQIVPLSRVGSTLTIAMTDPTNVFAMDDIKFMTCFNVEPVVASESAISEAIAKFYGEAESVEELSKVMKDLTGAEAEDLELAAEVEETDLATLERAAEEAPIIKLVNLILTDAVKRGASDIHIEPYEKELRVRFRIDGVLQAVMNPPLKLKDAMISRLKIMSKLDISEKRLPQDGRIMIKYRKEGKKKDLDFRVSTVPTLFGEKLVLRLQDPNIILGGESRDCETAEIAVKAALTGHLVLSTLHTNDAPSTISRLMNMGIEPFLVATSVNLICAQRLVRRICTNCKEPLGIPQQALLDGGFTPEEAKATTIYHGRSWSPWLPPGDRKSTCLNSSHVAISYAVFCLK